MAGMCNLQSCRTRSIPGTNVTISCPAEGEARFGHLDLCSYGILLKIMPSHGFYTSSRLCPRSLDGLFGLWLGHVLVPTKGWGNHRPNAMESQVFPCWASRITSCRWRFSWSLLVDRFRWRDKPIALPGLHLSGWSCHTCQQFPDFLLSEDPVAANWGLQGSPYLAPA